MNPKTVINATTYRNYQPANPTQYEEYMANVNKVMNPKTVVNATTYHNYQPANPTQFESYAENDYLINGKNETATYKISADYTKEKKVDMYVNTDYRGVEKTSTDGPTSRQHMKNIRNEDRKEKALDHREWDFVGGADQLAAGIEHHGEYQYDGHRGVKNEIINREHLGGLPYNKVRNVRGKISQNQRENIDNVIQTVLDGNPYVNNVVHRSISNIDKIDAGTYIYNRGRDERDIELRQKTLSMM
jgi:hypothetical protein